MRILVLQHLPVEHPGVLRDFFNADGFKWDPVEIEAGEPIPDLTPYDMMLVMGGPQDVWQEEEFPWLRPEKAAIRKFVADMRRPYLGICLGHQLLASALGGSVGPAANPEVGIKTIFHTPEGKRDPFLRNAPDPMKVLQWHGAEVTALPPQTTVLASSEACHVQAMRYQRHAYGLQFHVELTDETVGDWAKISAYAGSLENALGTGAVDRLSGEVDALLPAFKRDARTLYENLKAITAQVGAQ